ncbi:ankyrin repeat-containing domain protein [Nemania abortiva]|nr:ankyrin repeat-containing domain protein [Nemania abortiva]
MSLDLCRKRRLDDVDDQVSKRTRIGVKRKQLAKDAYTFGWIAALAIEKAAALAMLDEEHDVPLYTEAADTNNYSFGEIGKHNIIIALLPHRGYGTVNAAIVANNMHRSFPSLREYLLVGIAGGAGCSEAADVRLGDIVVSDTVVQYDLGKDMPDGCFKTTSIPLRPSKRLRGAVEALIARHEMGPSQIPELIRHMTKRHPGMEKFSKTESLQDQLFDPMYEHFGTDGTCSTCDPLKLIVREPRQAGHPQIHYGVVASGNSLIKSVKTRDGLAQKHGALCFEMEGAGIIEDRQCLVIRSICDYADSHKNDQWQRYAAAAAAAYAKELLGEIASLDNSEPYTTSDKIRTGAIERLMDALYFEDYLSRARDIEPADPGTCEWILHHPHCLAWLDAENFPQHNGFFWIRGKPGAGKSTLTRFAYERLKNDSNAISFFFNARGEALEHSIEGMYCSLLLQLLEALPDLKRVLENSHLLRAVSRNRVRWDVITLQEALQEAVLRLGRRKLICFVDALDECNESEMEKLVIYFKRLGRIASEKNVKFFIWFSSRHYPALPKITNLTLTLEDQAGHHKDLVKYVDHNLEIGTGKNTREIRATLLSNAAGVFLWVVLVVSILNKEYQDGRIFAVKEKLAKIPTGLESLIRAIIRKDNLNIAEFLLSIQWILYAQRPLRIEAYYFAILVGLNPNDTPIEWDHGQITRDDMRRFVSSSSKGLAEVTRSGTVRFIHQSVRDFFIKGGGISELWPELGVGFQYQSNDTLKDCCYAYIKAISSKIDAIGPGFYDDCESTSDYQRKKAPIDEKFPFLGYATDCVLSHADIAAGGLPQDKFLKTFDLRTWERLYYIFSRRSRFARRLGCEHILHALIDVGCYHLINTVVRCDPIVPLNSGIYERSLFAALHAHKNRAVDAILQIGEYQSATNHVLQKLPADWKDTSNQKYTLLSLAAEIGHHDLVQLLLDGGLTPNTSDPEGYTPLGRAASKGCLIVVKTLLDRGAMVDAKQADGKTSLFRATTKEVAQVLLDRGADVNLRDGDGETALFQAIYFARKDVVRLLLDRGANANLKNKRGETPLFRVTTSTDSEAFIQLLLNEGVQIDMKDASGGTALFHAIPRSLDLVKLFLDYGADVNFGTEYGQTPLAEAVKFACDEEVIKLLLARGARFYVPEDDTMTRLLYAIANRSVETLENLLAQGVEINVSNEYGVSPLLFAVKEGSVKIIRLLLARGAEVNTSDNTGMTPLHFAVSKYGRTAVVWSLLHRGANAILPNNEGFTPLDLAIMKGRNYLVPMLRAGAKASEDKSGQILEHLRISCTEGTRDSA